MASAKPNLGFIGLGLMGAPIALKLCRQGYPMTVWGRSPAKLEPMLAAGASSAESPAAVAAASDITFLCVTDTAAVENVVFGDNGIVAGVGASAGQTKILVDHSSIRPEATQRFAARLLSNTGMQWLDAPVSGGVTGVENKTLVVMAGGEQTAFDRVKPVVMDYAGRCTLMGSVGADQSTKLINQALVGVAFIVTAEVTKLAQNAGIDAAKIPAALAGGRADSTILQEYMPRMIAEDFDVQGRIEILRKDLETVGDLARDTNTPMPITALATQLHRLMITAGLGQEDNAATIKFFGA